MGLSALTKELEKELAPKNLEECEPPGFISTGDLITDYATSGGIPKGRITEILGKEGSGKTTMALTICGNVQREDGKSVVYIDTEKCMDQNNLHYAKSLGVNLDPDLFALFPYSYEDDVEVLLHKVAETAKKANVGIVVIDSVGGVMPKSWRGDSKAAQKKDGSDQFSGKIGDRALWWSKVCPFLSDFANKTEIPVILNNQYRTKIDIGYGGSGVSEEPMGGNAIRFFKSLSIILKCKQKDFREKKHDLTGEAIKEPLGVTIGIDTLKNRIGAPYRKGTTYIRYGTGFDNFASAYRIFMEKGLIKKSGNTHTFNTLDGKEVGIGVGENKAIENLRKYPKEVDELIKQIVDLPFNYFTQE